MSRRNKKDDWMVEEAKAMRANGATFYEIAAHLGKPYQTVYGWMLGNRVDTRSEIIRKLRVNAKLEAIAQQVPLIDMYRKYDCLTQREKSLFLVPTSVH